MDQKNEIHYLSVKIHNNSCESKGEFFHVQTLMIVKTGRCRFVQLPVLESCTVHNQQYALSMIFFKLRVVFQGHPAGQSCTVLFLDHHFSNISVLPLLLTLCRYFIFGLFLTLVSSSFCQVFLSGVSGSSSLILSDISLNTFPGQICTAYLDLHFHICQLWHVIP